MCFALLDHTIESLFYKFFACYWLNIEGASIRTRGIWSQNISLATVWMFPPISNNHLIINQEIRPNNKENIEKEKEINVFISSLLSSSGIILLQLLFLIF